MFKLYKINPSSIIPVRHGAMWDLAIPEDVTIQPGEYKIVGLGFAMRLEDDGGYPYGARVYARSSTFKHWGVILANGVGIIDPAYCGPHDEWKLTLYSLAKEPVTIPAGTRLAQFETFYPSYRHDIEVVDELTSPDRGGIGSTGL